MRRLWACLPLLAGCGGAAAMPSAGAAEAQIAFVPAAVAPPLSLADGTLHLSSLALYGDVERGAELHDLDVALVGTPSTPALSGLAAGVYSRLQLQLASLTLHGTWRGRQLSVCLALDGTSVDLRAVNDGEVAAGQTLTMTVAISDDAWWRSVDLDSVGDDDDALILDATHNATLAAALKAALTPSFSLTSAP